MEVAKYVPSPLSNNPLMKSQLVEYHNQFGEYVASWCEHRFGQQVGRGECWDLAHDALLKGCGKHAFVSTYTHHGFPILQVEGSSVGVIPIGETADEIRRGDILQFYTAKFVNKETGAYKTVGEPDHTSVVLENTGDKIIVAEQNVNGMRTVCKGDYTVREIVEGKLIAYRPVPTAWSENP